MILGLVIALPALVNLPESWLGAMWAVLLFIGGASLVALGVRIYRMSEPG
jgi:hypothetical protein